ncbi:restriction endonuclease subunit S [Salinimicrobium sp. GXAS 041]|uniref:restriction endonuclease subunit S n=1 Tax=Salinimicrobium sp. GXAS 041 TaxID=3400806 RepID=UPI003C750663
MQVDDLRGLSMTKEFRKSTSNIVGTDMSRYKIVEPGKFACDFMSVIRVHKLPVVLNTEENAVIVSPAYTVFEVIDENELIPEYLMMWFRRSEFDRYADFKCDSAIRGGFGWDELCEVVLPIPSPAKQREIVNEYNTVVNRIKLNEELNLKLEETAHTLFSRWFGVGEENSSIPVDLSKYIQFNPKETIPKGRKAPYIEMSVLNETHMSIDSYRYRPYKSGTKFQNGDTLFARITPCLENGKTGFVQILPRDEIAFGSTEFIVMRPKIGTSKFWVYCLARNINFRDYAISSMTGTSGRQRVHTDYLKSFKVSKVEGGEMSKFENLVAPLFDSIKSYSDEIKCLVQLREVILGKMSTVSKSIMANEIH